jgi:hypothetical protein
VIRAGQAREKLLLDIRKLRTANGSQPWHALETRPPRFHNFRGCSALEGQFSIGERQHARHGESSLGQAVLQLASHVKVVSARQESVVSESLEERFCACAQRLVPKEIVDLGDGDPTSGAENR